jgi:hypothetical protein
MIWVVVGFAAFACIGFGLAAINRAEIERLKEELRIERAVAEHGVRMFDELLTRYASEHET